MDGRQKGDGALADTDAERQQREIEREVDRREITREMEQMERREGERAEGDDGAQVRVDRASPDGRTETEEGPVGSDGARSDEPEGDSFRLLTRGVLANSPWKLFLGFRTVIAAAFGTGAYALIFPTIWLLADSLGWPRLAGLMAVAICALIFWMIVGHGLWETSTDEAELDPRVTPAMQNAVTVLTLTVAVLVSYAVLFGFIFSAALIFVSEGIIRSSLGHPVGLGDYMTICWAATSLSTITGALGSGLEDDEEIRDAVNYR